MRSIVCLSVVALCTSCLTGHVQGPPANEALGEATAPSPAPQTLVISGQDGLAVRAGQAREEGVLSTSLIAFDTPSDLIAVRFKQAPDWNNWVPAPQKVAPRNLLDAPVLLAIGPGDYWIFGRRDQNGIPDERVSEGAGSEQPGLGGYHAWHSSDMVHWTHHGPVTDARSRWVTSAEHKDGAVYIYYDYPNDQDPHLIIDRDLRDGRIGEDMGLAFDDPTHGSDAGVLRDLDGRFHLFFEDYSPVNARRRAWDSPLAGIATSSDGLAPFTFSAFAVDKRTQPTGETGQYRHPHWHLHPDWDTNIATYDIHSPRQDVFGDWSAIRIGDQYYLFGDYEPAAPVENLPGHKSMQIARFTSSDLGEDFELVGAFGSGHPDPTVGFAEGQFYLINQTDHDYVSPGPWVGGVSARAGIDTSGNGQIDVWTRWQSVQETYSHAQGFSRVVSVRPAELDVPDLPAAHGVKVELRLDCAETAPACPEIERLEIDYQPPVSAHTQ